MSALEIADIIGIISFALSGFLIAVHCKLDILGVFISAFLTAFGGGMTRDVLADRTPYVFTSNLPLSLVIATVLIAMLFKLHKITNLEGKWAFVISDAIGLSSFAITGAIIAIESDFNFLSAVMLAFITAVGGGTIRDVLINRMPFILDLFELRNIFSLIIVFIFGVVLRVLAYYKKWHLPTLSKEN